MKADQGAEKSNQGEFEIIRDILSSEHVTLDSILYFMALPETRVAYLCRVVLE